MRSFAIVLFVLMLTACYYSIQQDDNSDTTLPLEEETTLEESIAQNTYEVYTEPELASLLEANGFVLENPNPQVFSIIGARDGVAYDIDETNVEIYTYAEDKKDWQESTLAFNNAGQQRVAVDNALLIIHSEDTAFRDSLVAAFP